MGFWSDEIIGGIKDGMARPVANPDKIVIDRVHGFCLAAAQKARTARDMKRSVSTMIADPDASSKLSDMAEGWKNMSTANQPVVLDEAASAALIEAMGLGPALKWARVHNVTIKS